MLQYLRDVRREELVELSVHAILPGGCTEDIPEDFRQKIQFLRIPDYLKLLEPFAK